MSTIKNQILLVEDEESHTKLICRAFDDHAEHVELTIARSLKEARARLAETTPNLVLADFILPDGKGIEMLPSPEDEHSYPVVIMTSYGDEQVAVEAIKAGALDYVAKSEATLLDMPHIAKRALREWDHAVARRKAEEALRRSESQKQALINALPDTIFRISQSGVFLEFIPADSQAPFTTSDHLADRNIHELVPADIAQKTMSCVAQVLHTGKAQVLEFQLPVNNELNTYEARFVVGGENEVLAIIRDVTQRKQTDEQLRKLSRAVEQSPSMIMITDVTGYIEYVNPRFTQVTGYTLEETIGKNPRILKSDEMPSEEYENLWQPVSSGKEWQGELCNKKKSGEIFWVFASILPITDANGTVTHFLSVQEDITERKKIENTLLQRNRELILLNRAGQALSSTLDLDQVLVIILEEVRRLLNVVACSVWLIDPKTGELVCRQVTDPLGEIVRGWRLAPGQGIAGWVAIQGESTTVPDAWADERHFVGIDEKTGLLLRSILTVPLRTKQDVIGVLQAVDQTVNRFDSTDLRLIESLAAVAANAIENAHLFTELANTQTQLIQRERLAALGQMAATVAHELRNPLMAIRMGVEYLLRNVPPDDPRQRGANLMHTNMDRIDRIVEDILFVARAPQPSLAPALLHPIIEAEVIRWELPLAEKKIKLHLDLDKASPPILLDTHQISRALSNLVGNSVDALSPGGQIHLTLSVDHKQQTIITLADNGPGISPEHLSQVFEPFFTTKSRGTGLGLSIVKQIIEYHQGQIDVWSQKGVGTKFTLTLPALGS
jgi:PAS domain S-box-containing protein